MNTNRQQSILMDCLDGIIGVSFAISGNDKSELAQTVIDILQSYPKPKPEKIRENNYLLTSISYLLTITIINTLKLAQLQQMPYKEAFSITESCLEASLSLLIDKK